MIEIISIGNAHQWDGILVTRREFNLIADALAFSRFQHVIRYIDEDGIVNKMFIQ